MAETKVPALPEPSTVKDPHLRRLLASMKEALDIRLGRRGDSLDRAVTLRELYENGVVTISGRGVELKLRNDFSLNTPRIPTTPPPAPKNLTAQGAFTHVLLQWTIPRYAYHALTEIWRSEVDDLSTAQLVGVSSSEVYADPVDTARGYYYWVRFKSQADVTGPYNDTAGTYAETAVPPAEILDALEGKVTESALHADLSSRIDLIDGPDTLPGSVSARISAEQTARADADAALASDINQLSTTVAGNTATIQTHGQSIDGLNASYTVKIDVNGRVAGYGLASETNEAGATTSSFIVNADQFGIFHPSASEELVFGVSGGKTVMDGAYIKDATITDAKIANISADKISAATLSAISANMGTITAGKLQSVDGRVAIDMTLGTFSVKSGTSGARLEIKDNVIKVYDENGVLRVKLGDLSA
jgi:hypothetical protein